MVSFLFFFSLKKNISIKHWVPGSNQKRPKYTRVFGLCQGRKKGVKKENPPHPLKKKKEWEKMITSFLSKFDILRKSDYAFTWISKLSFILPRFENRGYKKIFISKKRGVMRHKMQKPS